MTKDLTHGQIADAASVWLSKPFSSLVVQELSTTSWGSRNNPQYRMDVVGVFPNGKQVVVVECKASRADFQRGRDKLEVYKGFSTQLYVAAPTGMLKKEDLPKGVGLLTVGPKGGARVKHWCYRNQMEDKQYTLMLERVLQKLVVARWQPMWQGRSAASQEGHWAGDSCDDVMPNVRQYLKHQEAMQGVAFQDWQAGVEEREVMPCVYTIPN